MHFAPRVETTLPFDFQDNWEWHASCGRPGDIKLSILNVGGIVNAPNPGAIPRLEIAAPQGTNPGILLLNLVFDQKSGIWSQVITPKPVGFTLGMVDCEQYDQVHIIEESEVIDIIKY